MVLVLTCREFDIQAACDEWDLEHPKTVKERREIYQGERIGAMDFHARSS